MAAIVFGPVQESGASELGEASPFAHNVVADKRGVVRSRPGVQANATYAPAAAQFSAEVSGLFATSAGRIFAVSGPGPVRSLYRVTSAGVFDTTQQSFRLEGNGRPVFVETEAIVAVTAGRDIVRCPLGATVGSSSQLSATAPKATHVIANNSRLLSNDIDNPGFVQFSDQAAGSSTSGHETWQNQLTSGFFSAEGRPDAVVAIGENTNEVFVWGTTTVQVFTPDASFFYAPAATREFGLGAPYAVVKRDQSFFWLDHRRRIVSSDARSFDVVSDAIQKTLDDIEVISDCWAFWYHEGASDCVVFVFPTDGRAFSYQVGIGWSTWTSWSKSNFVPFVATAHTTLPGSKVNLVGTSDGKIGHLTRDATTDYGEIVNAYCRTGFLNRDTDAVKQCKRVWVTLRRGSVTNSYQDPIAWLKWRDSPGEPWRRVPIELGNSGDQEVVVRLDSLGTYRRRQWEFTFSEPNLELASVDEDQEVTGE